MFACVFVRLFFFVRHNFGSALNHHHCTINGGVMVREGSTATVTTHVSQGLFCALCRKCFASRHFIVHVVFTVCIFVLRALSLLILHVAEKPLHLNQR